MASEDVLERATKAQKMIPRAIDVFEQAVFIGSVVDDLAAEIERLRADLVWSVRKGVMVSHDENLRPCVWFDVHRGVECDGTPDSICRALREARDGS